MQFYCKSIFVVIVNCIVLLKEMCALKFLNADIPKLATKGEFVVLRCQYELEDDKLYSVLWYKDNEEFYRYVPRNKPKQLSYKMEGFRVLTYKSNDHVVLLQIVNLKASGFYRCEVSAEAPSFTSVNGGGQMDVIAPPKEDPEINGDRRFYKVGDVLHLNCTSGRSYPSARLKWFVNDIQINSDYELILKNQELLTSISGLNFKVLSHHFENGKIKVRCESTVLKNLVSIDKREVSYQVFGRGHIINTSKWILPMAVAMCLT